MKKFIFSFYLVFLGCTTSRPVGLTATDSLILSAVVPRNSFDTISTVGRIISETPPTDWVELGNAAHTYEMDEAAFLTMQKHDDVKIIDQGLKMVGVEGVGKNPAHPLEREAIVFWMSVTALHDYQKNQGSIERQRVLNCKNRLESLKVLGGLQKHSLWMISRLQEILGEAVTDKDFPSGHALWRFNGGSYTLYDPPSDLRWKIGHIKMGGYIGKTVSMSCLFLFFMSCRPKGWEELTYQKVGWRVTLEFLKSDGSPTPMGEYKWKSSK